MEDEPFDQGYQPGELADELYDSLRGIARSALRRSPVLLDPTELVHQAWLRLSDKHLGMARIELLALCATIMRRIAVDEVRKRASERRSPQRITLTGLAPGEASQEVDLLELDKALDELLERDASWAQIIELRFFGGMSGDEVAQAMGVSRRTVEREWALARSWLKRALALG